MEAASMVARALRKRGKNRPQCIADVERFLDAPESSRSNFITRLKVISLDNDPVDPLRECFRYSVQPELLDDLCKSVIGIAKENADHLIRKGERAIIRADEFQTKVHAFIRTMNLPNLLTSFASPPSDVTVADVIATRPTFIRQLELIDANSDVRLRAVSDFLRASADKSIWADKGLIFSDNLSDWEGDLVRRHGAIAREVAIVSRAATFKEQGHLIYDRCTMEQVPLEGRHLPGHFIPGCFNSLANERRLGWHPEYSILLEADV